MELSTHKNTKGRIRDINIISSFSLVAMNIPPRTDVKAIAGMLSDDNDSVSACYLLIDRRNILRCIAFLIFHEDAVFPVPGYVIAPVPAADTTHGCHQASPGNR